MSITAVAAQGRPPAQTVPTPEVRPPAADVAAALQRKYDSIKDFSAAFTQTYEGGVLRRKRDGDAALVYVKKPGKMRWDYTSPEKKVFVSDGRTMFLYFPADRQVMKSPVPDEDQATSAVLFLMGKGTSSGTSTSASAKGAATPSTGCASSRRPARRSTTGSRSAADRRTLQIVGLTAADAQGGRSTFVFTNFKENAGLADKMFEFTIPRGAEVISSGKTP